MGVLQAARSRSGVVRRWAVTLASVVAAVLLQPMAVAAPEDATPPSAAPAPQRAAVPGGLPAQRSIRLFGATVRYHELGRGPTVVLVHGLGSSAVGDWGRVMRPLAATHRVLALDLLGFGASDKPNIDYGIQTWVDLLGEFLRRKQVDQFVLVGESMGGWIAAQYTLQALAGVAVDPAFLLPKPSKLVLADAAGHRASWERLTQGPAAAGEPGAPVSPIGASLAGQQRLMAQIFTDPSYQTAAGLAAAFAWSLGKGDSGTIRAVTTNRAVLGETIDGQLGGITVPTLVVWGEHDRLIPIAEGRAYADGIPGATLVIVPGCGHAPMIEAPAAFLEALRGFL